MDYDALEIDAALQDTQDQMIETLSAAALAVYIAESFNVLRYSLERGIVPNEAYQVLRTSDIAKIIEAPVKQKVTKALLSKTDEFTEIYSPPAQRYADTYKADLAMGGRTVRIGKWGEFDKALGYKPYLGYEEKWAPWLSDFTTHSRREIYDIITDATAKGLWPDLREYYHGEHPSKQKYIKGSLADELDDYFNKRKSQASMVARTETQHLRAMARKERHDALGYDKYKWLCGMDPCDMCIQFNGKEYTRADLPMDGDKVHPNCLCEVIAVIE